MSRCYVEDLTLQLTVETNDIKYKIHDFINLKHIKQLFLQEYGVPLFIFPTITIMTRTTVAECVNY